MLLDTESENFSLVKPERRTGLFWLFTHALEDGCSWTSSVLAFLVHALIISIKFFFNPNHHPLSENRHFSGAEAPLDFRPVCKLEFVHCGPVETPRALYLSWFNRGVDMEYFINIPQA